MDEVQALINRYNNAKSITAEPYFKKDLIRDLSKLDSSKLVEYIGKITK